MAAQCVRNNPVGGNLKTQSLGQKQKGVDPEKRRQRLVLFPVAGTNKFGVELSGLRLEGTFNPKRITAMFPEIRKPAPGAFRVSTVIITAA